MERYFAEQVRKARVRAGLGSHVTAYWLAKTHEELADETGVPVYTVKRALGWLQDRGLLIGTHRLFGGKRTTHLRPDPKVIEATFTEIEDQLHSPSSFE